MSNGLPAPDPAATCLVTGASSGIGQALARELTSRGYGLTLVARREERLRALASELHEKHGARAEVLACNLADPAALAALPARERRWWHSAARSCRGWSSATPARC